MPEPDELQFCLEVTRQAIRKNASSLRPRACRFDSVTTGLARGLPTWHSMPMPDYSLFGDEHVRQYEATGGKTGHDWNNTSCLVLHTIGRKSGATKKFPLIYGRDGNNYLIVASKGGAPDDPGWYKNLLAHPDVKIQVWDKVIAVRARKATAEEKKRVWPIMTAQWPDYDKYQAGTKRDIPVVFLTPR
jgi:deazaflavin-dependent oxidoreductase (nitroreductase family)